MCYQAIEVYGACHCLYYQHPVDRCPSYGRPGHPVQQRTITLAGWVCSLHSTSGQAFRFPTADDEATDNSKAAVDGEVSKTASVAGREPQPVKGLHLAGRSSDEFAERLIMDFMVDPQLKHLLPQVVRLSKTYLVAKRHLSRFLLRFSEDLKGHSETTLQIEAAEHIGRRRSIMARRIVDLHMIELDIGYEHLTPQTTSRVPQPLDTLSTNGIQEPLRDSQTQLLYDDATDFLFTGPPFESFQKSIKEFVEKSEPQHHPLFDGGLTIGSNLLSVLGGIYHPTSSGRKRLWWTCTCGRMVYDDYEELRPGALEDLEILLSSRRCSTPSAERSSSEHLLVAVKLTILITLVTSLAAIVPVPYFRLKSIDSGRDEIIQLRTPARKGLELSSLITMIVILVWSLFMLDKHIGPKIKTASQSDPSDKEGGASNSNPLSNNGVNVAAGGLMGRFQRKRSPQHQFNDPDISDCPTVNALSDDPQRHKFLLLCIPFMKWGLKLQQPDVCRVYSDRDFFRLLRKAYLDHRRRKYWKWLRRIQQLDFAQFELYHDSLVDIKATPSMPSSEAKHEYDYELPGTNPPIGPNLSMHLLENPDHAPVLPILVKRIPIRRKSRLQPCPVKGFSAGWGINFVEGVNGVASFACAVVGFSLCLVTALTWTIARDDVQGGFGIGAFILAFFLFCSTKLHLLL